MRLEGEMRRRGHFQLVFCILCPRRDELAQAITPSRIDQKWKSYICNATYPQKSCTLAYIVALTSAMSLSPSRPMHSSVVGRGAGAVQSTCSPYLALVLAYVRTARFYNGGVVTLLVIIGVDVGVAALVGLELRQRYESALEFRESS